MTNQRRVDDSFNRILFNHVPLILGLIGTVVSCTLFIVNPTKELKIEVEQLRSKVTTNEAVVAVIQEQQSKDSAAIQSEQKNQRDLILSLQKDVVKLQVLVENQIENK